MSDNILQTLHQTVQDVIAPDVCELKVRVASLKKQMDVRFNAMDQRFDAFGQKSDIQFKAIMVALSESKAQIELNTFRLVAALSERVAVLEAQRP